MFSVFPLLIHVNLVRNASLYSGCIFHVLQHFDIPVIFSKIFLDITLFHLIRKVRHHSFEEVFHFGQFFNSVVGKLGKLNGFFHCFVESADFINKSNLQCIFATPYTALTNRVNFCNSHASSLSYMVNEYAVEIFNLFLNYHSFLGGNRAGY